MLNALDDAERLKLDTVQVFTKNQQQWKSPPLAGEAVAEWKTHLTRLKFKKTVSHDSYLINLAASNPQFYANSLRALSEELVRADQLQLPFLVLHPGAHVGAGEEGGLS